MAVDGTGWAFVGEGTDVAGDGVAVDAAPQARVRAANRTTMMAAKKLNLPGKMCILIIPYRVIYLSGAVVVDRPVIYETPGPRPLLYARSTRATMRIGICRCLVA